MGEISGLECKPSLGNLQASFFEIFVSKFCRMFCFLGNIPIEEILLRGNPRVENPREGE